MAKARTTKTRADGSDKALAATYAALEKQFGKGIVFSGKDQANFEVETFPSGSFGLDRALGVGGYPRGRIIECLGMESSGKTSLTLHAIAEAQKRGEKCAFIDAEHALDPAYATRIGVNMDDLIISQPDSGEQALEIVEALVLSGAVSVIVVDSVAALVPQAEIDGEMGQSHVGLQARLMSQALRKLAGAAYKAKCTVFFINQIRMKIGVMFGNPETSPGGNALKFYSSVRLDMRKFGNIKEGDTVVGTQHRIKVVKNKVAPPFKVCEIEMRGSGFDQEGELVTYGIEHGLIDKSGAWYEFAGERFHGRPAVQEALKTSPDMRNALAAQLRSIYSVTGASTTEPREYMDEETGEIITEDDNT